MAKTPDYFAGKTIVITGAASGIGRATALIFAREKANVVCADIDEDGLAKTAEEVNALGSQALALTIDVTKRAAAKDMVQLAIDGFLEKSSLSTRQCRMSHFCLDGDRRPGVRKQRLLKAHDGRALVLLSQPQSLFKRH